MPTDIEVPEKVITAKNILDAQGATAVIDWVKNQESVLMTDTTFRDAHQSLLATRVRTQDFKAIAGLTDAALPELFSSEMGWRYVRCCLSLLNRRPMATFKKNSSVDAKHTFTNAVQRI